jgi:titin
MVERKDCPDGRWTRANFTNVIEMNFTMSGLTQNESYEFRVYAKNAIGSISNPSDVVGPITCVDSCGELSSFYFSVVKETVICLIFDLLFCC